jgi:flagellar hook-associated protein 1 FlgK
MADLLSILSGAQTSLAAQRGLTATASNNIDNANNPDYSRQIATIEAVVPADQSGGVYIGRGATLSTVTQARDRFLEAQLPQAFGDAAQSTAQSDALQALHALDPGASGGLDTAVSAFYSSLTALAQNPSDSGLRTAALGSASAMAQAFNRTAQQIQAARSGLDAQAAGLATTVDSEAAAVAQLNAQIAQAGTAGGPPNDLLDLRQKHLDQLATLTGATPVQTSNGEVNVVLANGVTLVAGARAGSLSTAPDPTNGGHLQITLTLPDGSGPVALPGGALSGSLGGTLAARDGALATAGSRVDQLAWDLAGALNAAHEAGYGLDGSTGHPLLDVGSAVTGAAGAMAVAISDPAQLATAATSGAPGDATNANALVATQSTPVAGGADVQSALSGIVSQFGAATATAKAFADQDGALKDQLTSMRDSYSGVSIDDEMISIQAAQRGYEAIAKVIETADQMMQTVIAMIP